MSTNNSTCLWSVDQWRWTENAEYLAHNLIAPIHILLSLPGHILSLVTFYKQSKKEKAYAYQIYSTISEIIEIFAFDLLIYSYYFCSGASGNGYSWFMSNYSLMWYAARLNIPIMHMTVTHSLLASLCMAADRLFAIKWPFKHKSINHGKHQITAFVVCILISVSTSIFDCFRFYAKSESIGYSVVFDADFAQSTTASVFNHLRNTIRVVCVVALIACNILIIYFYRNRGKQLKKMTKNLQKEIERKSQEKTLLFLTISQSIFTSTSMFSFIVLTIVIYSVPGFIQCDGRFRFVQAVVDTIIEVSAVLEFYVVFIISKQFRNSILQIVSFAKCFKNEVNSVAT